MRTAFDRGARMARVLVLAVVACESNAAVVDPPPIAEPARRPGIDLPGDVNGVWWDANEGALYLTDDTNKTLLRWSDARGFETVAQLPLAQGLGGVVRNASGRFLVTAFGFGTDGAIYEVTLGGEVAPLRGLDPARRRNGIAVAPDGEVYVAYFEKTASSQHGGIARLDIAGGREVSVVADLAKPVGVAATANTLYATDQHRGALVAYRRDDPTHSAVIESIRDPDLMSVLDGDLVVGTRDGKVERISPGGAITTLAEGFERVRGTAHDPAGKRLFIVEHSMATSRHRLHILRVGERTW